jgi:ribonuclease R
MKKMNNNTQIKDIPSRDKILSFLDDKTRKVTLSSLIDDISNESNKAAVSSRVNAMIRDGQISLSDGETISTNTDKQRTGIVVRHPRGFGFIALSDEDDWFLPYEEMKRCLPGEHVVVIPRSKEGRGISAKVVGRASLLGHVAGILSYKKEKGKSLFFLTVDGDYNIQVQLDDSGILPDFDNDNKVWVSGSITSPPSGPRHHKLKVSDVYSDITDNNKIRHRVLQGHNFPLKHSDEAISHAEFLLKNENNINNTGISSIPYVSIDGASSRDLDDLVFANQNEDGSFVLYVAIADVSHYVKEGETLDLEAYERGTSVYLPGKATPMLPEAISHELCSMLPNVVRRALVCEVNICPDGETSSYRFFEQSVKSHARFTYSRVDEIINDSGTPLSEEEKHHIGSLKALEGLHKLLLQRRLDNGAFDIVRSEFFIGFNNNDSVSHFGETKSLISHKMIESAMVCANVCAADFLLKDGKGLFRHHPGLQEKGLTPLNEMLVEKGIPPLTSESSGLECQQARRQLNSSSDQNLFDCLLKNAMTFARYHTEMSCHFGMSLPKYTHFTSPIRRYPDIIVHRMIKAKIGKMGHSPVPPSMAQHLTERAYDASIAERDACDLIMAKWWSEQPLEARHKVTATVTGVNEKMVFARIGKTPSEGALLKSDIEDAIDRQLSEGDNLIVNVANVDVHTGKIRLILP